MCINYILKIYMMVKRKIVNVHYIRIYTFTYRERYIVSDFNNYIEFQ